MMFKYWVWSRSHNMYQMKFIVIATAVMRIMVLTMVKIVETIICDCICAHCSRAAIVIVRSVELCLNIDVSVSHPNLKSIVRRQRNWPRTIATFNAIFDAISRTKRVYPHGSFDAKHRRGLEENYHIFIKTLLSPIYASIARFCRSKHRDLIFHGHFTSRTTETSAFIQFSLRSHSFLRLYSHAIGHTWLVLIDTILLCDPRRIFRAFPRAWDVGQPPSLPSPQNSKGVNLSVLFMADVYYS